MRARARQAGYGGDSIFEPDVTAHWLPARQRADLTPEQTLLVCLAEDAAEVLRKYPVTSLQYAEAWRWFFTGGEQYGTVEFVTDHVGANLDALRRGVRRAFRPPCAPRRFD